MAPTKKDIEQSAKPVDPVTPVEVTETPAPVEAKKKYRLEKSALKRNGKLYPQGSVIELTDSEYDELKHILAPVK